MGFRASGVAFIGIAVLGSAIDLCAQTAVVPINRRGSPSAQVTKFTTLPPEIRQADARLYKAVTDASDWRNPFLVVGPDGVEVRAKGAPVRTVPAGELATVLSGLSVEAWPYGRVAAVTGASIVSNPGRREATEENMKRVRDALTALGVEANLWPQ